MNAVRRIYLYAVAAVSLQATAWAVIALLRGALDAAATPTEAFAFQIAVVVTALPIFVVHWRWAQRDAARDTDERGAAMRRFYLYLMLAMFLLPALANAFGLLTAVVQRVLGVPVPDPRPAGYRTLPELAVRNLSAILVLAVLAAYVWRRIVADRAVVAETGRGGLIRRVFVLGLTAVGLTMIVTATVQLMRVVLIALGLGDAVLFAADRVAARETARVVVGLPLWIVAWSWAQRLFRGDEAEEHASSLRKFALYAAVFAGVLGTVVPTAMIVAGVLRVALDLPLAGGIEVPLPFIPVMAVVWAYHARVLGDDAARAVELPRQAAVRRLYRYLVGGVGYGAFLLGTAGVVRYVLRSLGQTDGWEALANQLAWATSAVACGLPVWLWQWRHIQRAAVAAAPEGAFERASFVRRLYLYFFLFVATITVLSSAIYVVFRIVGALLGAQPTARGGTGLAEAVAYGALGVLVWLLHGRLLRADARRADADRDAWLTRLTTAVVDLGDGASGRALVAGLARALPALPVEPVGFSVPHRAAASGDEIVTPPGAHLADAQVIVAAWTPALAGASGGAAADLARAIAASPARKILLPVAAPGWSWAGVPARDDDEIVKEVAHAITQVGEGETVTPTRELSAGQLILLAIAGVLTFAVVVGPIVRFILADALSYLISP